MNTAAVTTLIALTLALAACTATGQTPTRDTPVSPPTTNPALPLQTSPGPTTTVAPPAQAAIPTPTPHAAHGPEPTEDTDTNTRPRLPQPDVPMPTETQAGHTLIAALSASELDCLELSDMPPRHLLHPGSNPAAALACLSAPNLDLFIAGLATPNHPALAPAAATCLSQQRLAETAKGFSPPPEAQATPFLLIAAASYALATCLSREQWSALGYSEQQRQLYTCISRRGITTPGVLEAVFSGNQEAITRLDEQAAACQPPVPEPGNPPDRTDPQHPRFPAAAEVARRHTGTPEAATLLSVQEYTWSNGAMGCPQPGQVYTEALVEGYVFHLSLGPQTVRVHSNSRGTIMFVPTNCVGGATP